MRHILAHSVLATLLMQFASHGHAQTEIVDAFLLPEPLEMKQPIYPFFEQRDGHEGVVDVHFMVDEQGKAFEPTVTYSMGSDRFHDAAIKAVLDSRFKPAMKNGKPIVGSMIFSYRFHVDEEAATGARPLFSRRYQRFNKAMAQNDLENAKERLDALLEYGSVNMYEHAFLGLAQYYFAASTGDTQGAQLDFIQQALNNATAEEHRVYLDEEQVRELRRGQFVLQVSERYFADAVKTYEWIDEAGDTEGVALLQATYQQLLALKESDQAYSLPLTVGSKGVQFLKLFKHHMYITELTGTVSELKLRCDTQYISLPAEVDFSYDIPPAWGDCSLQILGDPDSTFILVQH